MGCGNVVEKTNMAELIELEYSRKILEIVLDTLVAIGKLFPDFTLK
jgi:hypothetical protein